MQSLIKEGHVPLLDDRVHLLLRIFVQVFCNKVKVVKLDWGDLVLTF